MKKRNYRAFRISRIKKLFRIVQTWNSTWKVTCQYKQKKLIRFWCHLILHKVIYWRSYHVHIEPTMWKFCNIRSYPYLSYCVYRMKSVFDSKVIYTHLLKLQLFEILSCIFCFCTKDYYSGAEYINEHIRISNFYSHMDLKLALLVVLGQS